MNLLTGDGQHRLGGDSLWSLTKDVRRLAFVGLAKNTGKTVALGQLLCELDQQQVCVGVTSVGRDGEQHDVIDVRIEKPLVRLRAGSLVCTTEGLLRDSALPYELVEDVGIRTALGSVLIARLCADGAVEVAGPSGAQDIRMVSETMLAAGAQQVLVDGAIDRRAASSPAVSDGLVLSTGAVLDPDIERVVAQTREAVDLVRLPEVDDELIYQQAIAHLDSVLIDSGGRALALAHRFALSATEEDIAKLMRQNPDARGIVVRGALCENFLEGLVRGARGRHLEVVVADSTKVFLSSRSCESYRRHGISIAVLRPIRLLAITVNPLAPHSHSLDSVHLRSMLESEIPDIPVLDVLDAMPRLGLLA